mmetsp:Transcript_16038/g.46151  ORF Transcript_16038/g.46151 Transcript_16038/m.46151 type:complete len:536 (-) Transcript_16038:202-1809(-)
MASASPTATAPYAALAGPHQSESAQSRLHSLVEAATALTQLVSRAPAPSPENSFANAVSSIACAKEGGRGPQCVSEDELTLAAASAAASASVASTRASSSASLGSSASSGTFRSGNEPPRVVMRHAITPPPSPPRKGKSSLSKKSKSGARKNKHTKAEKDGKDNNWGVGNAAHESSKAKPQPAKKATKAKAEIFPQRLLRLLADPSVRQIITWLPHGRSFVILRPDLFAESVLPAYFPESKSRVLSKSKSSTSKYPSFTRKLNRWGFRQINRGPESGAFCNELFRRDEPQLCLSMECEKSGAKKTGSNNLSGGKRTPSQHPSDGGANGHVPLSALAPSLLPLPSSQPIKKRKLTVSSPSPSQSPAPLLPLPSEIAFSPNDGGGRLPPPRRTADHLHPSSAPRESPAAAAGSIAPAPTNNPPPYTAAAAEDAARRTQAALEALRQLMDSSRRSAEAASVANTPSTMHAAAAAQPLPRHRYEPSLHLPRSGQQQLVPIQPAPSSTVDAPSARPAVAAAAAEGHMSALYKAYLQALNA